MENEFIYRYYSHPYYGNRVSVVGKFQDNQLKLAVSRCSNSDNFSKAIGRGLAEKRLKDNNLIAIFPMKECSIKTFRDLADFVADMIRANPSLIRENKKIESPV